MGETPLGRPIEKFTDYVLTIEGDTREEVFDFLDRVVVPTLGKVTELDVGLSSHTCNDDGDTYHSLLARNEILAQRLEDLLAERNELLRKAGRV
jgi:hypothetical protein